MGRRGWVSVEDAAGDWWRLSVFDDGWVELPGFARGLSDTRAQLRQLLFLVGGFGVLVLLSQLAGRLDGVGESLSLVLSVLALGLLLVSAVLIGRFRARDRQQAAGDRAQAARQAGRVRRRPGTPWFRRARTSAEFAAALEGVRRVGAEQVGVVVLTGPEHPGAADPLVVSVLLHDGSSLTYRTPDAAARELFAPFLSRSDG
ncbi:hypothetical protein SAMN05660199_00195 [Klenkia soli]|uniref:Uncharacterized protein n=1 Tax=Klenkia soli TaxID=1052260 RepID=A0A1H0C3F5_9ACTN|nr:hypothetical protein [Klenkia soli]SDN52390.1 hypothetical protein SAMN05660199_00195 [Klenkia soli]